MSEKLKFGKGNLIAGWLLALLFFLLGWYLDAKIKDPLFSDTLRTYLRRTHVHGLAFAILNILVGLCVDRSGLGRGAKQLASWVAILGGILFPLGLFLLANQMTSIGKATMHTGGLFMVVSILLMLLGFATLPSQKDPL